MACQVVSAGQIYQSDAMRFQRIMRELSNEGEKLSSNLNWIAKGHAKII